MMISKGKIWHYLRLQITMDRNTGGQWFTCHIESERPRSGPEKAKLQCIAGRYEGGEQWFVKCGGHGEGGKFEKVGSFWEGIEHIKEYHKPAIIFAKSHLYNRLCRDWGKQEGIITVQC